MYVLYSNMSCHFKVVYHTGKGIKLNPLPITLMTVLENLYCTAALAFSLFSISFFSPFYSFIFLSLPLVCCVIPSSDFLPSSLFFSEALFFFFHLSDFLSSCTKGSQGCVPVCPSYVPWLMLFLCCLVLSLLHLLPVFPCNLPTIFSFLFLLTG